MENGGFEGKTGLRYLQKTTFNMDEKNINSNKRSWFMKNRLLVLAIVLISACTLFSGFVWLMQLSIRNETKKELGEGIKEFRRLKKVVTAEVKARFDSLSHQHEEARVSTIESETNFVTRDDVYMRNAAISRVEEVTAIEHSRKLPWKQMRLPTSIFPNHYDLILNVDMNHDKYEGNVTINVNIVENTNFILLHSIALQMNHVEITNNLDLSIVAVKERFYYTKNEFYVIETKTALQRGISYDIKIRFSANMSNELNGFYASRDDTTGKKVAATFFSPISARKAFPCLDEPLFKANFTLTLRHDSTYMALSNMKSTSVTNAANIKETKFATTLKMSTYLFAWVISEYKYIESKEDSRIRAWAYDVEDVRFGLHYSTKLLKFYEDYFNISYPLAKLDLLPIPNFSPGAMENWGIITFRAERFLINPKSSTQYLRQKVFFIMAHELVHQWFGNLVTMSFWNDAWLKESFANNIGAIGGHHVNPNMGVKEQALTVFMIPVLEVDAFSVSHPISSSVKTPGDIRGIFDLITYNKGSCLIDLLHHYLGEHDFRKGMQSYLTTYAYKNANQDNLWDELSKVSGKNVKSIMDTWTLQLGFPLISLERINSSFVKVNQERFSLDPPDTKTPDSPFSYIWKVPLIFKSLRGETKLSFLLETKEAVLEIPDRYLILNPDHALYYRVMYDEEKTLKLSKILKDDHNALSVQDRTGLISDQFSLVAAKKVDIRKTMELLSYLKHETDYYPWQVAFDQLSFIRSIIADKKTLDNFDKYIKKLTSDIVEKTGWKNITAANEGRLQELLLSEACQPGSSVYKKAEQYYLDWIFNRNIKLRPSLYPVFKTCAISSGPDFFWNYAYYRYTTARVVKEDNLLWSMTSTEKEKKIKMLLEMSLNTTIVNSQNTPYVIGMVAKRSKQGRLLSWNFIKENWGEFIRRYGTDIFMLPDMLSDVLDNFSAEEHLNDVKTFFHGRFVGSAKNAVNQAIIKIQGNIEWRNTHMDKFSKWLDKQNL